MASTLIAYADKSNALTITNVIVRSIITCTDFQLEYVKVAYSLWQHLHLWQRIHVVTNLGANNFANMLYVIQTSDNALVVDAKEK